MSDRWICNGMVYITGNEGWGVDSYLRTFKIGTEQEILESKDERIIRNLNRAGVNGVSESEQDADGGYEGSRTAMSQGKPPRAPIQRIRRSILAKRIPRNPRSAEAISIERRS